jgi:hypothetical protein
VTSFLRSARSGSGIVLTGRPLRCAGPIGILMGLLLPISASAQISLVNVTSCGPQTFPASVCTIPATGQGHLLVIGWQIGGGANTSTAVTSVTDNVGNTYAEAGAARSVDTAAGSVADIWYAANSVAGATSVTITPSTSVNNGGAVIWEFSGVSTTSPLDQTAILNSQSSSSTPSGASVTTTAAEVIISLAPVSGNITGINSGNAFVNDSTLKGNGWSYLVTSTAGVYSAQWTESPAGTYSSSTASFKAGSVFSPCDLNQDGVVNLTDVQLAENMALGSAPCTANIGGAGVCNIAVVQRVVNAALGGACVTGGGAVPHYVSLTWTASVSSNVAGYNVYRGSISGGPYTKINTALVTATAYTDSTVQAGQTYYYVCTSVDTSNNESADSTPAVATIPSP